DAFFAFSGQVHARQEPTRNGAHDERHHSTKREAGAETESEGKTTGQNHERLTRPGQSCLLDHRIDIAKTRKSRRKRLQPLRSGVPSPPKYVVATRCTSDVLRAQLRQLLGQEGVSASFANSLHRK